MNEKVTQLAIASRIILIFLQFISNLLIPDHNPNDVFKSPLEQKNTTEPFDRILKFLFGGLLRWDAEYFLHISEIDYTYENTLAFYPLYPYIIRYITKFLLSITFYISFRYIALFVSIIFNIYCFYHAANCLYDLTHKIFGDLNKSWNSVILFCFNPASIFFSAPYSESLYCWLTFNLMLECVTHIKFFKTTLLLCLSMLCRSNGLLNLGYPIYFILRKIFMKKTYKNIINLIGIIILSLIPLTFYNFYIFQLFCQKNINNNNNINDNADDDDDDDNNIINNSNTETETTVIKMKLNNLNTIKHSNIIIEYAKLNNLVLSGNRDMNNSPWCDKLIPIPYAYIQKHYWNIGFLNYYQLKQIPNFLLALPILILIYTMSFQYIKNFYNYIKLNNLSIFDGIIQWKSIPFIIHCLLLTIFCTLFIHIQVTTRLIASASPCLYWYGADYLPKTFTQINFSLYNIKSRSSLIVYWFGSYFVIGTILFSNFYPWT